MTSGLEADCMADSQKYYDCGKPTLIQGGWQRAGAGNAYVEFQESTTRISTLDFVPTGHPNNIKVTGIASKTLEVSALALRNDNYIIEAYGWQANGAEFNVGDSYDKLGIMFRFQDNSDITPSDVEVQELGEWKHSLRKLTTATADIEPTIYTDGTAITSYTIKGNTVQDGTPTPSNPIYPQGCGDLVTEGEHAGQYKIPILNGQQTTPVYLGEVQTTRKIKKLVLDGTEDWNNLYGQSLFGAPRLLDSEPFMVGISAYSAHFIYNPVQSGLDAAMSNGEFALQKTANVPPGYSIFLKNTAFTTAADFKSWLASQYAAGTPVTIWYVLATPTTDTVNEPLMKIGDYADSIANATAIPTTDGANQISIDTTVQPSEFTATWTGWHNANVKEWDGSDWQQLKQ